MFDKNQSSPYEVDKRISTFLQQRVEQMKQAGMPARDLLFYYIGHGVFALGSDQAFHLAIRSTRDESLRASAIAMAALAETLKTNARQLRRFVILDCCFAAEAFKYMQSAPYQAAQKQTVSVFEEKSRGSGFPRKGTTLLCSSGHKEASLLLPDESGTMFSEAFTQALVLGNARQREKTRLSLYDVKTVLEGVLEHSTKGNAPRPFVSSPDQSDGDVASIPFFPNPRAKTKHDQEGTQISSSERSLQKIRQKWLKEGNSIRDLKRSEETLKAIEQAIRQHSNDAVAYYAKGYTLNDLKRPKEALVAIEQAIRLDSSIADFYKGKGNVLLALKQYKEALEAFEQAIHLNPNYVFAYTNKGVALNTLKRHEEALKAIEQAIRLAPNDVTAYYNKGLTLKYLKQYEAALTVYEQAIRLDPHNSAAHSEKGLILNIFKRHEEALKAVEQAIRLDPHSAVAYNYKSIILGSLNRDEEALKAIEQAILIDPTSILAYFGKGFIFDKAERYEEALINYEKAIRLDPNSAWAYYNKSLVLRKLKRDEEARATYEQAIRLDPSLKE